MRLLVVDDHPIVRRGLRDILAEAFPDADILEAATGQEALACYRQASCDLVLLDLSLPDQPGLEVLKALKLHRPLIPVLVVSLHAEDQYAIRAIKAGAAGYLTKESAPEVLMEAVTKVMAGGKFVSSTLAERLADHFAGEPAATPFETLSDRELEVLCRIARGKTVTEIGEELGLSVKTVSTYRSRLLEKLHLHTTPELIRYAIQHGLVP